MVKTNVGPCKKVTLAVERKIFKEGKYEFEFEFEFERNLKETSARIDRNDKRQKRTKKKGIQKTQQKDE
jgi:hypothetical protein